MFYTQEQYDEAHAPLATHSDAMREYAENVGRENAQRAWILTDYDVWMRNPFYCGPAVPHPEEERDEDELFVGPPMPHDLFQKECIAFEAKMSEDDIPF